MLLSIALMLLVGMAMGWLCQRVRLPSLIGMIATGILLGPYALDLMDASILGISPELRKIALIIILARAGLSLDVRDLKRVGLPAILMCFLPACFEIAGMILVAPRLLGVGMAEAALMGAVVGAVSPAVIVPKMIRVMEEGYGVKKGIPQLILAGAAVDDVFVIVVFTAFLGLLKGGNLQAGSFLQIPVSILTGILAGTAIGVILASFYKRIHARDTVKVVVLLCVSFILVYAEDHSAGILPFSGLIAVMCLGISFQRKRPMVAERLSRKFSKLWVVAEIMLFVLVGATVNLDYAASAGPRTIILVGAVLLFRMAGVFLCLIPTDFNGKEKLFCMMGYMPKATVQAAIGGIPLAAGLDCGNLVLTVAVLSILIAAPLGAFLIETGYRRLLKKD